MNHIWIVTQLSSYFKHGPCIVNDWDEISTWIFNLEWLGTWAYIQTYRARRTERPRWEKVACKQIPALSNDCCTCHSRLLTNPSIPCAGDCSKQGCTLPETSTFSSFAQRDMRCDFHKYCANVQQNQVYCSQEQFFVERKCDEEIGARSDDHFDFVGLYIKCQTWMATRINEPTRHYTTKRLPTRRSNQAIYHPRNYSSQDGERTPRYLMWRKEEEITPAANGHSKVLPKIRNRKQNKNWRKTA